MIDLTNDDKSEIRAWCFEVHAQTIKHNGKVYVVPDKWKEQYEIDKQKEAAR